MFKGEFDEGPLRSRLHTSCACPSACLPCNPILTPFRKLVSKKKRRYVKDGFNLDLTYLTDRIIVHGFPATGIENIYRNPRSEVARFLETKHPGRYKVYNFCCEAGRGYDEAVFDGRVERYPFRDHGVPPLETMAEFCNSAKAWLDSDPSNVVCLHCKAGKGRAGIMACCLLLRLGFKSSAEEAMDYYGSVRVTDNKGLTVVSQRKFVTLYERLWIEHWKVPVGGHIGQLPVEARPGKLYPLPPPTVRNLTSVEALDIPHFLKNSSLFVKVRLGSTTDKFHSETIFTSSTSSTPNSGDNKDGKSSGKISRKFLVNCSVTQNFCIQLFNYGSGLLRLGERLLCELWHNASIMDASTAVFEFPLKELDARKKIGKQAQNLTIRLNFGTESHDSAGKDVEMRSLVPSRISVNL